MATRVYSPAGEPFDIPRRDLADKLILQEGWTQTAPVPIPVKEAPKAKKRYSRKALKKAETLFGSSEKTDD
jgi:hypothetical protein